MHKNVKANQLVDAVNAWYKKDLTNYINFMYSDTKPFATYVGMNTKEYENFYFNVTGNNEENWSLYSSHFEGNKLCLFYSAYENNEPKYKIFMNINTEDYSCIYDLFNYTRSNCLLSFNNNKTMTHYRLESTLNNRSKARLSDLKKDDDLVHISHNFYYMYTKPIEADSEMHQLDFERFISKYGYQVDDKEFICDAPHTTEEEIRKHLNDFATFSQEQIEQVINKKLAESYIDGENIYDNDEETINHHLKYKEHLNQKRRELIRVIQDNKKTNK